MESNVPIQNLEDFKLKFSDKDTQVLKALKTGKCVELPGSDLKVLELDAPALDSPGSSAIFVRSFYPRFFETLAQEERSIIFGNPGLGKSSFQLYVHSPF